MTNMTELMEAGANEGGWAGDVAFLAGGRRFTHFEVHDGAARTGSLLAAAGVGRGGRVMIALPDGIDLLREDLEAAAAAHPPAPAAEVTAEDVAYAQFTSGTTSAPKEARHAH